MLIFNYKDGCKSMSFRSIMDAVDKSAPGSDIGALTAPAGSAREQSGLASGLFHIIGRDGLHMSACGVSELWKRNICVWTKK